MVGGCSPGGKGGGMRSSELLWYRSRDVSLWWLLALSSPVPFFVCVLELLLRSPGLVKFGFLVLFCVVGCFCGRVMTPPCSPVFW